MNWLLFALLAPAISSTVNFLDKYIVRGQDVDYQGMPIFAATASVGLGSILWAKEGYPLPGGKPEYIVVLAGLIAFAASVIYFRIINSVAVSKIIILFQITPVFVLSMSYFFLGERLTWAQISGFILIIIAALGLTRRRGCGNNSSEVTISFFILIIVVDLFYAASNILLKYATEYSTVSNVYIYQTWGMGIGAAVLFLTRPSARKSFWYSMIKLKKRPLILVFLNEGIFNVGKLLTVEATSMKSVSLVNVVGSTQVFFGILYGWMLNKISPQIFQENSTRRDILIELIFASIMFAGVLFLY